MPHHPASSVRGQLSAVHPIQTTVSLDLYYPTKVKLSARGSLLRRLNSAPSPTTLSLMEYSGKENSFIISRSPNKLTSIPDDQDSNSQDSGCIEDSSDGRFQTPTAFLLKRNEESSPIRTSCIELTSPQNVLRSFSSSSFNDSFDDGFSELGDVDKPDENAPLSIANLLTGQLISVKEKSEDVLSPLTTKPPLRRALSMVENNVDSGIISRVQDAKLAFKRPRELSSNILKRRKSGHMADAPRHKLQRSVSETAATSLASDLNLHYGRQGFIADFSRPYALPIETGKHADLTTISPDTMAAVIRGDYSSAIRSYTVIDCRYPYEFEGGHIRGAVNLYTCDQIENYLFRQGRSPVTSDNGDPAGRNILIFHCEFSVARGPSMYRWLRRLDRSENVTSYPCLHYPEVYLLNGGYNTFHSTHKDLCEPTGYRPMLDPGYEADLRKFRGRSTSWSGSRTTLKRLGLL